MPRVLSLVFVTAILAAACAESEPERPLPGILEATAVRNIVDGEALSTSTIAVRMDRDFSLAQSGDSLASHFELLIPDFNGRVGEPIPVQAAGQDPDDGRTFLLQAESLIPAGTTLTIARSAFREGAEGTVDGEILTRLNVTQVLFALTQFQFADPSLVAAGPTAAPDPDEHDVDIQRESLQRHLIVRGDPPAVVDEAIERFDSMPPAVIPSPKLRAAIAALTGTFAGDTYEHLFTGANCTGQPAALIAFQPPPNFPQILGRSTRDEAGRLVISINPRLSGERIELLMPLLAHEAIHCDESDGRIEEIAATAFDTLLYVALLVPFPELPSARTELSREFTIDALAMLNSGRIIPESGGILPSAGLGPVLPGSAVQFRSFADLVAASYLQLDSDESPVEPLAVAYARNLEALSGMEPGDPFDLFYLDELIARSFTASMLVAMLDTLFLEPT